VLVHERRAAHAYAALERHPSTDDAAEIQEDGARRPGAVERVSDRAEVVHLRLARTKNAGVLGTRVQQASADGLLDLRLIGQRAVAGTAGEPPGRQRGDQLLAGDRHALPEDGTRPERRPPSDRHQAGAIGSVAQRPDERLVRRLQCRPPAQGRHADLLRRRHVVHELRVQVGEGEPDIVLRQRSRRPGTIAVARANQPGSAAVRAKRPLTGDRGARPSGSSREAPGVARALLERDVQLGAERVLVSPRIGADLQAHAAHDIAVEHRQRPGVAATIDGVLEPRCGDTVDHQPNLPIRAAAHREVAAKIVATRHAWHRLGGLEPIARENTAGRVHRRPGQPRVRPGAIQRVLAPSPDRDPIGVLDRPTWGGRSRCRPRARG